MPESDYKDFLILMIPVVFMLVAAGTIIFGMVLNYKKRKALYELHHKLSLAAIEKGTEIPPLPEAFLKELEGEQQPEPAGRHLLKGMIWLIIGLIGGILFLSSNQQYALASLIPIGIGITYIVYYCYEGRKEIQALNREAETADKSSNS